MISVVMAAYNRAHTLPRAIASVLAQTHPDWELIVVDDGSQDGTEELLATYHDPRIVVVRHPRNRGVTAAKNTGFDHARGDWLTTLDSDDEMVPQALGVFMKTLEDVDPELDAIACNCFDSRSGRLTGTGLDRDQYISLPISMDRCRGEHWGMFHRRILGANRFNEHLRGYESVLWHRIHEHAKWYYVHRGLRIYHTEGDDRLTAGDAAAVRQKLYTLYATILEEEPDYVARLRRYSGHGYRTFLFNAAGQFLFAGDEPRFEAAAAELSENGAVLRSAILRVGRAAAPWIRSALGGLP
ncbi:MAG TPA: glycosyltransferase family 2 protein [Polyangiaceae bacterium]